MMQGQVTVNERNKAMRVYMQAKGGAGWHKLGISGQAPTPRGWFAATAVPGGMLIHGGNSPSNERLQDMYILDLHEED